MRPLRHRSSSRVWASPVICRRGAPRESIRSGRCARSKSRARTVVRFGCSRTSSAHLVTRTLRLLLLVVGLSVAASLVWYEGPRLIAGMLARVGWRFAAAAAIYAMHVGIRAVALWRSLLDGPVRFADVLRIRLSGEAVEMLTFTGPFLAEPAKGWLLTNRGVTT